MDERLGCVEGDRQSEHRLRGGDQPKLSRLSQLLGDLAGRGEIDLALDDVPELELGEEPVNMRLYDPFRIADPLGQLAELAR